MSSTSESEQPHDVASRVLRRAQVSKMTRVLHDRLALANIKIKRGWQNRSMDSLEPEIEKELKRKRSNSNNDVHSDTSSAPDRCFSTAIPNSSPLTGPIFSDEINRSGSSHGSAKRFKVHHPFKHPASSTHNRNKVNSVKPSSLSWKSTYKLPQSSPIRPRPSLSTVHNNSFVSQSSTILNSPSVSEDDDQDLPVRSFQLPATDHISSSPPRTPPPDLTRSARLRTPSFSSPAEAAATQAGKEGADLLLYLASSPSPAMRVTRSDMIAPSTPPSKHTPLPSSMMSTPGGQTYFGFGPNTPSAGFNFADFVNVTPSPAQGPWSRTPAAAKTPLAAREARRRLEFGSLAPPSPNFGGVRSASKKETGLGMELGGELVT